MKTMTKTVVLLILTFVLGVISGAVLQGFLIRQHIKKFNRHMRTPEGFIERFERIIDPTDEQRKEIRAILEKHHQKMMQFHKEFPMHMDSLKTDLDSILTEEQKEKLKKMRPFIKKKQPDKDLKRWHRWKEKDSDSHPPFPPPPPPSPLEK
ncbi:hypothetical protein JW835_00645 [bacterium]|nr:hypothetical protein [bacterium]